MTMPGFDRTGPFGRGSRTGGGMGYCGRGRYADHPGYGLGSGGRPWGGGRGRCWGGGGGWNRGWSREVWDHEEEHRVHDDIEMLAERVEWFERELNATREELERAKKKQ
ncbi:MAG: DUF5320 domain-containing protein [bacterium]